MKLFLDTADVEQIGFWHSTGLVDGVTTNPSHLAKQEGNLKEVVKKICSMVDGDPVSIEVTQVDAHSVYKQAKEIASLADNIIVKIPCHSNYYGMIKKLVKEGIPLNITLVFTAIQGMLMCKLGVKYISPFVGRLEDIDVDGIQIIPGMREVLDNYAFETQLLAASIRSVRHVHDVMLAGADVATVSPDVLQKMVDHPLTDLGMKKFLADWHKSGITNFP